jgi:integrase
MAYLRAGEALSPVGVKLDVAAHEYASATLLLGGRATLTEVCRDWLKRHAVELPRVSIKKAADEIVRQAEVNGRSIVRVQQLHSILGRFARDCNMDVQDVTPAIMSQYLSGLPLSERSKRNYRDTLGFFCRFCVMRGYLQKGTDWLEGVQKYTARKMGAIEIYTPEEFAVLLHHADKRLVPFLAISAFARLRHTEIGRLDWSQIEDGTGETFIEVRSIENTKSDQRRRLVPIRDNLKAWLLPHRKAAGKVCPFEDIPKQLLKTARRAKIKWKHNALRHSCISYRVAECGNVPLVSDESGNSVSVIRTNYLRRVKPAVAAEWFGVIPPVKARTRKLDVERVKPLNHVPDAATRQQGNGKWVN